MRWTKPKQPKDGDEIVISKFLIFPMTLGNETRWLEKTKIVLRFYNNMSTGGGWGSPPGWWYERWAE